MKAAWWALCLLHLVPGLAATAAPDWFAAELAGLATGEVHYVRDVGVGELTLAALSAVGALRPALSRPLVLVLAAQLALHSASHAVDRLGGPVVPLLLLQAALLAVAFRSGRSPADGPPAPMPPSGRAATPR